MVTRVRERERDEMFLEGQHFGTIKSKQVFCFIIVKRKKIALRLVYSCYNVSDDVS